MLEHKGKERDRERERERIAVHTSFDAGNTRVFPDEGQEWFDRVETVEKSNVNGDFVPGGNQSSSSIPH